LSIISDPKKTKESLKFGENLHKGKEAIYNHSHKIASSNCCYPSTFVPNKNSGTTNMGVFLKPSNKQH
jgi:hypothetical protein